MKNFLILIVWVLSPTFLFAQTPEANELFQLRSLSISDLSNLSSANEGTLVYNPEQAAVFYHDGTQWVNTKRKTYSGVITITDRGLITERGIPFSPSRVEFKAFANVDAVNLNDDNSTGNNNDNSIQNSFGYMAGFAQSTDPNRPNRFNQQVIYGGGSGRSINDISRFANDSRCIAIRYANDDGVLLGTTAASFRSFLEDGFQIRVTNADDELIVIYTAYQ